MTAVWSLARRELSIWFGSLAGYVLVAVFLLASGAFFTVNLFVTREASLHLFLENMGFFGVLFCPLLSMRLVAAERQARTLDALLGAPVSDRAVALGKFLGAYGLVALAFALTLPIPVVLLAFGEPQVDVMVVGYIGTLMFYGLALAAGLAVSAVARSQGAAAVVAFFTLLALWFLGGVADRLGGGVVSELVRDLSPQRHLTDFVRGFVRMSDVAFFLVGMAVLVRLSAVLVRDIRRRG